MPFEGLSRLSQLTAFASDYNGNARRGELYKELAPLRVAQTGCAACHTGPRYKILRTAKFDQRARRMHLRMDSGATAGHLMSWAARQRWGRYHCSICLLFWRRERFSHMRIATLLSAADTPVTAGISRLTVLTAVSHLTLEGDGFSLAELALKVNCCPSIALQGGVCISTCWVADKDGVLGS